MTVGFTFFYGGSIRPFTPPIYARDWATSPAHCVAEFAQITDAAWVMGGSADMITQTVTSFDGCVDACRVNPKCQYITFDYSNNECKLKLRVLANIANSKMPVTAFKAVVGGDVTASSTNITEAKAVASGLYSYWRDIGANIGTSGSQGPTNHVAACLGACDDAPDCAAVAMAGVSVIAGNWDGTRIPTTGGTLESCWLIYGSSAVGGSLRSVTKAALGQCNRLNQMAMTNTPPGCADVL